MALPRNVMIAVVGGGDCRGVCRAEPRRYARGAGCWWRISCWKRRALGANPKTPVALGNRAAMVLLQEAESLNPNSPDILRALAEAADVARKYDTELDALKNLVRLEPKNLVAQVQFLDLLARAAANDRAENRRVPGGVCEHQPRSAGAQRRMGVRLYRCFSRRGLTGKRTPT